MKKPLYLFIIFAVILTSAGLLHASTGTTILYKNDEFAPIGPTTSINSSSYVYRPALSYTKKILFGGILGGGSGFLVLYYLPKIQHDAMTTGFTYLGIVPALTSLGVYLAGLSESEPGGFLLSMLGGYIGCAATTGIYSLILMAAKSEGSLAGVLSITLIGTLTGAILGYNLDRGRYGAAVTSKGTSAVFGIPDIFAVKNIDTKEETVYCRLFRMQF